MFGILFFALLGLFGCDNSTRAFGTSSQLFLVGERPDARFGGSGDIVGDINGDGFADIAVGAPGDSRGGDGAGTVYIYFGSSAGPSPVPSSLIVGGTGDALGDQVAAIGDINGDNIEDLAFTSRLSSRIGAPSQPAVYIYFGGSAAFSVERTSESADIIIFGSVGGSPLVLSSAGDLDQSLTLDLAIGSPGEDRVYIFFGGTLIPGASRILLSQADLVVQGVSGSRFGEAIAAAGDLNGQNLGLVSKFGDEVAIGAPSEDETGAVYVLLGVQGFQRGVFSVQSVGKKIPGSDVDEGFGSAVAGIGDFDQDGFGDLAVGAPSKGTGRVDLFFGRSISGPSIVDPAHFFGEFDGDAFGSSVTGLLPFGLAGDFPLIVGAPLNSFTAVGSGSAYLFSAKSFGEDIALTGITLNAAYADLHIRNPEGGLGPDAHMGSSARGGLDVNGDGIGDLLFGSPGSRTAGIGAGGALVLW